MTNATVLPLYRVKKYNAHWFCKDFTVNLKYTRFSDDPSQSLRLKPRFTVGSAFEDAPVVGSAEAFGVHDVGGCACGGDAAVFHQGDVAGVVGGEVEVVQHHDDGHALFGQCGEVLHQAVLIADVEMVGRLIKKEDFGILQQRADDGGALLFAAGEGLDAFVLQVGEVEMLEQGLGASGVRLFGPPIPGEFGVSSDEDVFRQGHGEVEMFVLPDPGDFMLPERVLHGRSTPACLRMVEELFEQGGLARAVGADDRADGALGKFGAFQRQDGAFSGFDGAVFNEQCHVSSFGL